MSTTVRFTPLNPLEVRRGEYVVLKVGDAQVYAVQNFDGELIIVAPEGMDVQGMTVSKFFEEGYSV